MAIIYRCDVCKEETRVWAELKTVKINTHDGSSPNYVFDICEKCRAKMFKPVKEYRSKLKIRIEANPH